MSQHLKRRTACRLCDGRQLELVVPITPTPVADAYVTKDQLAVRQECYPLDMYQCRSCGHVQLLDVVDPAVLFAHYSYFSGQSSGLVKHFEEYADNVVQRNALAQGGLVVDVGSNDGTFLQCFKRKGFRVLGIDPAVNVARFACEQGVETLPEFLNAALARRIRADYGPAQVVSANNVFAHTDDMAGMADSIRALMADDGIFVFEVSYLLDVMDKMLLGTIFHEHVCYHTVGAMQAFLQRHGMELIDVERVSIQGGSLIGTAQVRGGRRPVMPGVGQLLALEKERKITDPATLRHFSGELNRVRDEVRGLLHDLHGRGHPIAGFGAARGGTLLLYHFELGDILRFIVDDSPDKQGLYSPGHHIPVLPTSALYEQKPDYAFILAWVHSKPIIRNHQKYLAQGGKFITCFPGMMVVDKNTQPFW